MIPPRIRSEFAPSSRAESTNSFGTVSKTPRMMKTEIATDSAVYGSIRLHVSLISPSRF